MYSTSRVFLALAVAIPIAAAPAVESNVADGAHGVVASRSALASQVGVDVMKAGGSAVDAAVAVGFALAVTYPSAGNLGGGGFMVIHLANGDVVANDHRETAPASASRDMYLDENGDLIPGLSTASHLAVGVPGTVAGLLDVRAAHGTLSVEAVIAPALKLAEEGFALPDDVAAQLERLHERFAKYPASVAKFTKPNGLPYQVGDTLKQSTLEIDARFNITLTPRVTIEIFAQPLLSSGKYQNLKELRAPRSFDFNRYGVDAGTLTEVPAGRSYEIDPDGTGPATPFRVDNEDFNIRSLRSNVVFRWEWRPGSTLFLVWQQTRSGRLDASDPDSPFYRVGNFRLGRDAGDLFELRPDNVFMIKLSYWLNP